MADSKLAADSSAGARRAALMTLGELNQRSASLGVWEVGVCQAHLRTYTYISKRTGQEMKGATFSCLFVSLQDPGEYVAASVPMKGQKMEPLYKAETKFKNGNTFKIYKVGLDSKAKQEYLHAPIKLVIDLTKTHTDPMLRSKFAQPILKMTIKDCKKLLSSQRFDVMAIVETVSESRQVTVNRHVIPVQIIDDSGDDGKAAQLTISFFYDFPPSQQDKDFIETLRNAVNKPQTFFAVQGKQTDTGYSIEADRGKDFSFVEAKGDKADRLTAIAESLRAAPPEMREVLLSSSGSRRDYEAETGLQVVCKLLADLQRKDLEELNEKPTVFQLNWVEVAWPTAEILVKKDGTELWFQVALRDVSGQVENVWMGEKPALALAQVDDKEQFLAAHAEGKQLFPQAASIKVLRQLRDGQQPEDDTGDASQFPGSSPKSVNLVIVQAADQALNEAPNKSTLEMISFLRDIKDDTSAIVPAALHMAEESTHYAFTVKCPPAADGTSITIPCQKILALVRATKSSKTENIGAGLKLTTEGVYDLMSDKDPTGEAANKPHTLSFICTLENVATYKLDPPRGVSSQHALITITGKVADVWVVESVQLIKPDAVADACAALSKLLALAMHIHTRDRKRAIEATEEISPAKFRCCSQLSRYPTDIEMPELPGLQKPT